MKCDKESNFNIICTGFSFSQHSDVTIASLCNAGWDKVLAVFKDSTISFYVSSVTHTDCWYSLVYLIGKRRCLVPATQQDSKLLQVNTQQKHAFLKKRDTSCTGRGSISYQSSWCSRKKQIDAQVQKPLRSASAGRSYLKQDSLRSVSNQHGSQSQSAAISQTCTTTASEPKKPRYQTHVTQHKAEHLLKQCQRKTAGSRDSQPYVPSPRSSILLITSVAFFTYLVLNCTFLQCILLLHHCIYLQSALRMIYIKTPC